MTTPHLPDQGILVVRGRSRYTSEIVVLLRLKISTNLKMKMDVQRQIMMGTDAQIPKINVRDSQKILMALKMTMAARIVITIKMVSETLKTVAQTSLKIEMASQITMAVQRSVSAYLQALNVLRSAKRSIFPSVARASSDGASSSF